MEDWQEDIGFMQQDLAACFLALANALDAMQPGAKRELAQAAQERMLVLKEILPPGTTDRMPLLQMMATQVERKPAD